LHVAVDLRILDRDGMERTGIGRYALEATRALRTARPEWRIGLHSNRPDLFEASRATTLHRTVWPTRFAAGRVAWLQLSAAGSPSAAPDAWWGPAFTLPRRWRGPSVVTIHDLLFLLRPELYRSRLRAAYAARATASAAGRAGRVLCGSGATRDRLVRELDLEPGKIVVSPWGVSDVFRGAGGAREDGYILFVGRWEVRKGLGALHAALRDAAGRGRRLRLVLAGGPGWRAREEIRGLRNDPDVEVVLEPSDERLASLYAGAMALVYPSRMEGFGFPVAEAMASGCPVIASDLPELRELAGDAAAYVAPDDPRALAATLIELAADPGRRRRMAARGRELAAGLGWERCGEITARAIEGAVAERSGARRR
jgi:glycosyltransferase involved in cell wall biosynthesis